MRRFFTTLSESYHNSVTETTVTDLNFSGIAFIHNNTRKITLF